MCCQPKKNAGDTSWRYLTELSTVEWVDQTLQASQRSATPIHSARAIGLGRVLEYCIEYSSPKKLEPKIRARKARLMLLVSK